MKTLFTISTIIFLFSIGAFPQRETKTGGRGQESTTVQRINRNNNNAIKTETRNPQRTIVDYQQLPDKTQSHTVENYIILEQYHPSIEGDCIVYNPDKYNFPDRIFKIPYIEPVLQYFYIGDFDEAIELLNYLIDENPFVPELYFLRGVAYIKRKSDFKNSDYWEAQRDFFTVKTLDPAFPGLKHYLDLLDLYLFGKRPVYIETR